LPPAAPSDAPLAEAAAAVVPEAFPQVEPEAAPAVHTAPEPKLQGSAISQALSEVMDIVESLKHANEQMEEVLELVELAERQKIADEHEIESLRRALRQMQRPRSSGPRSEEKHLP
jgi:hypothetical protein